MKVSAENILCVEDILHGDIRRWYDPLHPTYTICQVCEVELENSDVERKAVLFEETQKVLVLNFSRLAHFRKALGEDFSKWIGKKVTFLICLSRNTLGGKELSLTMTF